MLTNLPDVVKHNGAGMAVVQATLNADAKERKLMETDYKAFCEFL